MFRFQNKRVKARKILLDKCDVVVFRNVPDFIVDSFFGECNYKKRLIVCTFAFLNGISLYQLLLLVRWKQLSNLHKNKIVILLEDFSKTKYQEKFYSYNIHHGLVMYLNGNVKKKNVP